jgi:D-alanyl-D-alanine carboxypeptidase-like protein
VSAVPRIVALLLASAPLAIAGSAIAQDVDLSAVAGAIASSYPDMIASASADAIVWKDGSTMPLGAVREPDAIDAIIRAASVAEQFLFAYPLAPWSAESLPVDDPGRIRSRAFFAMMYGDCRRGEVQRRLKTVVWLPHTARQRIQITAVNRLDRIVAKISDEIEMLPLEERLVAGHLAGSFVCRPISGTAQASMHAYGAALDLKASVGRYWRWSGLSASARRQQRVPQSVIAIFERNGFIWGGKWLHVDSIHFEYRPELIAYAKIMDAAPDPGGSAAP